MKKIKKILLYILLFIFTFFTVFMIYEVVTINNKYYIQEKNLQIPIFTYHNIVKEKSEIQDDCMQTTLETFKKQIIGLIKLGYEPINYEQLIAYNNGEEKISKWSFLITFDDGYANVYEYAYPFAKEYNIPMTIFIIDDCIGSSEYFSWEKAKEMKDSGLIDIYSHGLSHIEYNKIESNEFTKQINQAYINLQDNLNDKEILKVFAYPYGKSSEDGIKELAEKGYVQNLMDNRINNSKTLNLNKLHRCYPCNDSVLRIILKQQYRFIRYK